MEENKKAIIIGAGPAGLTAAYELVTKSNIAPIIFELSGDIGGISKTTNYKDNRIDLGGHRFFSKSDRVMNWWQTILPLEVPKDIERDRIDLTYHNKKTTLNINKETVEDTDKAFILRRRYSSIYYRGKFFDYPITLSFKTLKDLGFAKSVKIIVSYALARISPIKPVVSLEDFYINSFGKELYQTFFKSYTEKLWGTPPSKISAEWGAQRVKGVSIRKVLTTALKSIFAKDGSIDQKKTETSLIQRFLYPKKGPGQLWEEVADKVQAQGGKIYLGHKVVGFKHENGLIKKILVMQNDSQQIQEYEADYIISTMPVKELIKGLNPPAPQNVTQVAQGLEYRDFITVGVLANKLKRANTSKVETYNNLIPDNWLYIHEPGVKMCRVQIFNNWSSYMVADLDKVWMGLEYVCSEKDDLWKMSDDDLVKFGVEELEKIGLLDKADFVDGTVLRMPKAYPGYFGTYKDFDVIKKYVNGFDNLYLVGRNGMHRYNNQDHSMLTAMETVEQIINGKHDREKIWNINTEEDYHEEK